MSFSASQPTIAGGEGELRLQDSITNGKVVAQKEDISMKENDTTIVDILSRQAALLQSQAEDIAQLRRLIQSKLTTAADSNSVESEASISLRRWKNEILQCSLHDNASTELLSSLFLPLSYGSPEAGNKVKHKPSGAHIRSHTSHDTGGPSTFEQLFAPTRRWQSNTFRVAHPLLARFLSSASPREKSYAQIKCIESYEDQSISKWPIVHVPDASLNMRKTWAALRTRVGGIRVRLFGFSTRHISSVAGNDTVRTNSKEDLSPRTMAKGNRRTVALTRAVKVSDTTPLLTAMLLESSPNIHQGLIALFFERYLSYTSWAQASVWAKRSITCNSYVFEYHFPTYYISSEFYGSSAQDAAKQGDMRGLRKSAPFGPATGQARTRYIHEEQLSFIVVGVGRDVYTCYQLGETYFSSSGKNFMADRGNDLAFNAKHVTFSASVLFLSWLRLAAHHLDCRWRRALEAVNEYTDTASHIVFAGRENTDLLSDDPQFGRCRTYFWALQVYKMYEERLSATIQTWDDFQQDKLFLVDDGRVPPGHWKFCVEYVQNVMTSLRARQSECRRKIEEVHHLREGLFGASALFDSRTAVRQGDNIQLLTYITLLFLPLSFGVSVFGMQVVLPNLPIRVFAIALPCIFVTSGLLIFNLQTLIAFSERIGRRVTSTLEDIMERHHRHKWREVAIHLEHDRLASQPPVKKIERNTSKWVYLLLLIDLILIQWPVREVNWALKSLLVLQRGIKSPARHLPRHCENGGWIREEGKQEDEDEDDKINDEEDDDAAAVIDVERVDRSTKASSAGVKDIVTTSSVQRNFQVECGNVIVVIFRCMTLLVCIPIVVIEYLLVLLSLMLVSLSDLCLASLFGVSLASQNKVTKSRKKSLFTKARRWLGLA